MSPQKRRSQQMQSYTLDKFSIHQLNAWAKAGNQARKYQWAYYCALEEQRAEIREELKNALASNTSTKAIDSWCRIVPYQFANTPLSSKGSILHEVGGRFNIGSIEESRFPKFPALYIAEDFETAYREKYGLESNARQGGLTAKDLIFCADNSFTTVSIHGNLEYVLNINNAKALKDFVDLVKHFKISKSLIKRAKKLKLPTPSVVKDIALLQNSLFDPNWRFNPQVFEIPSNPQIFGQIAHAAGIEGILYKSKHCDKDCLAIYPENIECSTSFLEITGEVPGSVQHKRLDKNTWNDLI